MKLVSSQCGLAPKKLPHLQPSGHFRGRGKGRSMLMPGRRIHPNGNGHGQKLKDVDLQGSAYITVKPGDLKY